MSDAIWQGRCSFDVCSEGKPALLEAIESHVKLLMADLRNPGGEPIHDAGDRCVGIQYRSWALQMHDYYVVYGIRKGKSRRIRENDHGATGGAAGLDDVLHEACEAPEVTYKEHRSRRERCQLRRKPRGDCAKKMNVIAQPTE